MAVFGPSTILALAIELDMGTSFTQMRHRVKRKTAVKCPYRTCFMSQRRWRNGLSVPDTPIYYFYS